MKHNTKLRILAINIFLIALLFGSVSFNKEIIRPAYNHIPIINMLTGSFPNFIAAYIISMAVVVGVLMKKSNHAHLIVFLSSTIIFLILTIEEFRPIWGASSYYDIYDIVASGLGSLLAILTFEVLLAFGKFELPKSQ